MKQYILDTFRYREYAVNFTQKIKEAERLLRMLPTAYDTVGLFYRGYDIHFLPYKSYLFFFVMDDMNMTVTVLRVMQDAMDWKKILIRWLKHNQ